MIISFRNLWYGKTVGLGALKKYKRIDCNLTELMFEINKYYVKFCVNLVLFSSMNSMQNLWNEWQNDCVLNDKKWLKTCLSDD